MKKRIAIFGAGMTGLSAGRMLVQAGHKVDIYEASDRLGGLATTFFDDDGFVYDNGPRFIFSTLAEKVGIRHLCEPVQYWENLLVRNKYYRFPFGFIRNPRYCISVGLATMTRNLKRKPQSLGEFLRTYYGRTFSKEVLIPLINKWSGVPADDMSVDFASRLLPTNIAYIIHSLIKKIRGGVTEDYYKKGRYIVYPQGSNAEIFTSLAATPNVNIHFRHPLSKLETRQGRIISATVGSKQVSGDVYISTIPIHLLPDYVDQPEPLKDLRNLHYRGIVILFVKTNRKKIIDNLWTWFPEEKYPFYRISEPKNARADLIPEDKTLLSIEFACEQTDDVWTMNKEKLLEFVQDHLFNLYGLRKEEVIGLRLHRSPCAYPVLAKATETLQRALTHRTPFENLFIAGRTGNFQYRMLEGCFESAMTCAETVSHYLEGREKEPIVTKVDADRFGRPLTVPE